MISDDVDFLKDFPRFLHARGKHGINFKNWIHKNMDNNVIIMIMKKNSNSIGEKERMFVCAASDFNC